MVILMTVGNIDVETTIERVQALIAEEKELSPALKSSLEVLLVTLLVNRLGLNSKNSSKPPATDPPSAEKVQGYERPPSLGGKRRDGSTIANGWTIPTKLKSSCGSNDLAAGPCRKLGLRNPPKS
jgi:transposase